MTVTVDGGPSAAAQQPPVAATTALSPGDEVVVAGGVVAASARGRAADLLRWARGYFSQPRWWIEVLLVWSIYQAYSLVRNLGGKETTPAFVNAERIQDLQRALHLDIEPAMNAWLHANPWAENLAALHYHTLHWWMTIGVAVWLYLTNRPAYRRASLVLALTTLIALAGFYLIPTAPPRMFDGYVDSMASTSSWGWWGAGGSPGPESITNEVAAMPSLHCGWAIWAGMMLAFYARRRWVKALGIMYPITTMYVVMATANHWILDIIAVMAILAFAMAVVYAPWHRLWARIGFRVKNRDDFCVEQG